MFQSSLVVIYFIHFTVHSVQTLYILYTLQSILFRRYIFYTLYSPFCLDVMNVFDPLTNKQTPKADIHRTLNFWSGYRLATPTKLDIHCVPLRLKNLNLFRKYSVFQVFKIFYFSGQRLLSLRRVLRREVCSFHCQEDSRGEQ